jgi:hypothetical protein
MIPQTPQANVSQPKMSSLLIAGVFIGCAMAIYLAGYLSGTGKSPMSDELATTYVRMNLKLPEMMDEVTRCDAICPGEADGKTLIYKFTLIGVDDLDATAIAKLRSMMVEKTTKNYKDSDAMSGLRKRSVILRYQYFDVKCSKIMEFTIDPKTF